MRKVAVFVEGKGELIFIRKLILEIANLSEVKQQLKIPF